MSIEPTSTSSARTVRQNCMAAAPSEQSKPRNIQNSLFYTDSSDGDISEASDYAQPTKVHHNTVSKETDRDRNLVEANPSKAPTKTQVRKHSLVTDRNKRLWAAVDFGNGRCSGCFVIYDRNDKKLQGHTPVSSHPVISDFAHNTIPAMAVIVRKEDGTLELMLGQRAQDALKAGKVKPKDIMRMLKCNQVITNGFRGLVKWKEDVRQRINKIAKEHEDIMRASIGDSATVKVVHPTRKTIREVQISMLEDITEEFLRYLLDMLKIAVQRAYDLSEDDVEYVFRKKADLGIGVPSVWPEEAQLDLRSQLDYADWPASTLICSEAKSAAIFTILSAVMEGSLHGSAAQDTQYLIADIGFGTGDFATIEVLSTQPAEVKQPVLGGGSFCGSGRLQEIFCELAPHWRYDGYSFAEELHKSGMSEEEFFRALSEEFEDLKCLVDGDPDEYTIRYMAKISVPNLGPIETPRSFVITRAQMHQVYDLWVAEIIELLDEQLWKTRSICSRFEEVAIVFVGGGSRSQYLIDAAREHCKDMISTQVLQYEPALHSSVAQGILWTLQSPSSYARLKATDSIGTRLGVNFDGSDEHIDRLAQKATVQIRNGKYRDGVEEFDELDDTIVWASIKGQPLKDHIIEGRIFIENEFDKITLEQDIIISQNDEVALKSDAYDAKAALKDCKARIHTTLKLKIGPSERAGFRKQVFDDGTAPFIEV